MARFSIIACLALAAGSIAGCSQDQPEAEQTAAAKVADPRIAALKSINSLKVAEETCKDVQPIYSGVDADLTKACINKLEELILRDEISDFNAGLRYFKKQLTDGRMATIEAFAAQAALNHWLRKNAPKATNSTLNSWLDALPEEDKFFTYSSMRSTINDAWKE